MRIPSPVEDTPPSTAAEQEARAILEGLRAYARSLGKKSNELLAELQDVSSQEPSVTPECLSPLELAAVGAGAQLAPTRQKHLTSCKNCQVLLTISKPDKALREEFLAVARDSFAGTKEERHLLTPSGD